MGNGEKDLEIVVGVLPMKRKNNFLYLKIWYTTQLIK